MSKKGLIVILITSLLAMSMHAQAWAADQPTLEKRNISIKGRKTVVINHPTMLVGDLCEVFSQKVEDDDAVIALQKLEIDPSPAPGKDVTVAASRILERMKEQGVNLDHVVYTLPRISTVTRASRTLSLPEIEAAIREELKHSGREYAIKRVNYNNDIQVPPSTQKLTAVSFLSSKPGQLGFTLKAEAQGEEPTSFDITAAVDEWIEMPTAGRPLTRGSKITKDDVVMARLNVANLPSDTLHKIDDVVGQEANAEIQYGEPFRKNRISSPSIVLAGSKVLMVYKIGSLEATATGTAMEAGILGQDIRIKNESSKKIISGKVLESGKIEVTQ